MTDAPPELSAVITCYFEEQSIDEFYGRLRKALEESGRTFEVVLVNDGSTDRTWERLKAIHARDPHVTGVDLFRNAGQRNAMAAGIEQATGEHFLFMDSDLQLDPEDLPKLLTAFDAGADVVSGARVDRQDALTRKLPSFLANVIMRKVSRSAFTDFGCTYKLYRGNLVRAYETGPRRGFNPPYVIRAASRCVEVPVTHHPRRYGTSGWTFRKLWRFNMDNLVGYSEGTFQYLSVFAFLVALLTFVRICLAYVVPELTVVGEITTGMILNALLLASAFMVGVLALIGEYVLRSWAREHQGPLYVVREVLPKRAEA